MGQSRKPGRLFARGTFPEASRVGEILREEAGDGGADIVEELRNHVRKEIGAIAKPRQIMIVAELPKTRSGKIMRRLLRDVAEHREIGDVTTLADSTVMDLIKTGLSSGASED